MISPVAFKSSGTKIIIFMTYVCDWLFGDSKSNLCSYFLGKCGYFGHHKLVLKVIILLEKTHKTFINSMHFLKILFVKKISTNSDFKICYLDVYLCDSKFADLFFLWAILANLELWNSNLEAIFSSTLIFMQLFFFILQAKAEKLKW